MKKLFEVGDRVRCHLWKGVAEITAIDDVVLCPILVTDDSGSTWRFLLNGKYYVCDSEPTLRHDETGSAAVVGDPPERFAYPLYRKGRISGAVVEFDSLTTGTVLNRGTSTFYFVGEPITDSTPHTDPQWEPCEKPAWEPTKPTWCWVWGADTLTNVRRLIARTNNKGYIDTQYEEWPNAEPCRDNELPSYWPKEWA